WPWRARAGGCCAPARPSAARLDRQPLCLLPALAPRLLRVLLLALLERRGPPAGRAGNRWGGAAWARGRADRRRRGVAAVGRDLRQGLDVGGVVVLGIREAEGRRAGPGREAGLVEMERAQGGNRCREAG